MKKQTIRNKDFVCCVFGDRTRRRDNLYWETTVQVLQATRDLINNVPVYIVDDAQRSVLGVGVINTHRGFNNTLTVNVKDIHEYTSETKTEVKQKIFKDLHTQN